MNLKNRRVWMLLGSGILALGIVLLVIMFGLGSILRSGMNKVAPKVTGTSVEIGPVMLSPLTGRLSLSSLEVGNPEGFDSEYALRMDYFRVEAQTKSLFSNLMEIDEIVIRDADIFYEDSKQGNNLKVIQQNVSRYTPKSSKKKGQGSNKKVIIGRVLIKDLRLHWKPSFKSGDPIIVELPEIEMKNIGSSLGGVSPEKAVSLVLSRLTSTSTSTVQDLAKDFGSKVKEGAESVGEKIKSLF